MTGDLFDVLWFIFAAGYALVFAFLLRDLRQHAHLINSLRDDLTRLSKCQEYQRDAIGKLTEYCKTMEKILFSVKTEDDDNDD
jgi:hypothetical protein